MKKKTLAVLFLGMVTVLGGCSSLSNNLGTRASQRNPAPCPNVVVLNDAARMIEFAGGEQTAANVAWTGEIKDARGACRYVEDRPIEAQVEVDFAFGKGPAAQGNTHTVNYFVAVTRTNRDLIARQEFSVPVTFRSGRSVVNISEAVNNIIIPRKDKSISGVNFEIIVGLSVSKDQLLYNRSGKSLKFPQL